MTTVKDNELDLNRPYEGAVVIFGGSGFIGTHLARHLSANGERQIYSIDSKSPREKIPGVTHIDADVRDLSSLVIDGPIAAIFNLAAVHTTPGHPDYEYYDTNVNGAIEVTKFAQRHRARRIVFTSSISVYGPGEETKTEESTPNPVSAYGRSKLMAERIHGMWQEEHLENRLVVCRPAVIFGAGEGGNFSRLAKLLRKGFFVYPGRRDTIKSCFYVKDLVVALLHADKVNQSVVLFNGCYADRQRLDQIIATFKEVAFSDAKEFLLPKQLMIVAATILRPISSVGFGIHPDRIMKLIQSTDIVPNWLENQVRPNAGSLRDALEDWSLETDGDFW